MRKNAYLEHEHTRADGPNPAGNVARGRRAAQSLVDGIRSRRVRRLPRGNGASRIPARLAHVAAFACEGAAFIRRRARLNHARRTDSSLVNHKEPLM